MTNIDLKKITIHAVANTASLECIPRQLLPRVAGSMAASRKVLFSFLLNTHKPKIKVYLFYHSFNALNAA